MSGASVIVAKPSDPASLVLLFHGVGSTAGNLVPLAQLIARQDPRAMVVSVSGPHPSSFGTGREWFSVAGITEENRPARVAEALPGFERVVGVWQTEAGLGRSETTLVGFSQGAIMSLESTQGPDVAGRVVSLSGRFAQSPRRAPAGVPFRFIHGELDPVIDPRFSLEAAGTLQALGADASVRIVPGLTHGIDEQAARLVLEALA